MTTTAIVLAGGAGTRVQASENKVYLPIADRPLISWSLDAFEASPLVDEIVLVIRDEDQQQAARLLAARPAGKVARLVTGGATRHASERNGLEAIAAAIEAGDVDLVLIHDGARPFVRQSLIEQVVTTARTVGGAVPGLELDVPVLLRADEGGRHDVVPADDVRRVQTPQGFAARELLDAYRAAEHDGFAGVDTAEAVQRYSSLPVDVVPGDPDNVKVTFVEDLFVVEELAARWDEGS